MLSNNIEKKNLEKLLRGNKYGRYFEDNTLNQESVICYITDKIFSYVNNEENNFFVAVSYTHLTLPTIYSV